jgi:hypothetical protein
MIITDNKHTDGKSKTNAVLAHKCQVGRHFGSSAMEAGDPFGLELLYSCHGLFAHQRPDAGEYEQPYDPIMSIQSPCRAGLRAPPVARVSQPTDTLIINPPPAPFFDPPALDGLR